MRLPFSSLFVPAPHWHVIIMNNSKNILIVCGDWYAKPDANINIVKNIKNELISNHYSVTVLSKIYDKQDLICNNEVPFLYCFKSNDLLIRHKKEFDKLVGRRKKIKYLLRYPKFLSILLYMKAKSIRTIDEFYYIKHIRRIIKRKPFKMIIGVTFPNESIEAVSKFTKKINTAWIQLDACAESRTKRVLSNITRAIVPNNIYNNYIARNINVSNVKSSGMPNIVRPYLHKAVDNVDFPDNLINIVFLGRFYENIRSPEPLINIFEMLNDKKLALHIIGMGCEDVIESFRKKHPENVFSHGKVSAEAAFNAMQIADFLVNVDNNKEFEILFPSKINDYLSTGKPIINIYSNPNSSVLEYLAGYENVINIDSNNVEDKTIDELKVFLKRTKTVPFDEIYKKYYSSTPQYVCQLLLE